MDDSSLFAFNQVVRIGDANYVVQNIVGEEVVLDGAVTAAVGTPVLGPISFEISYRNTGNADATNVVITDLLPAQTIFLSATDGGIYDSGYVTWSVGTLKPGHLARSV